MDCDQIFPKLWVGSCPRNVQEIDRLVHEARISAILSLLTDHDIERLGHDWPLCLAHCALRGVELHRFPIIDGNSEDLRERLPDCVRMLDELLVKGHTVYLHCVAGIERSPSVVIAYFCWCMGYELDAAASYLDRCRGCSPDHEAIALATRDLLREGAIRERIERKAAESSSGVVEEAGWKEATKLVLRELIAERRPPYP
ncbi:MAG TPA: dual specificity protein phosphatase family protein [Acidobacteriota bacterium]|nr:dual specificity protein phosphatase family protein [Acidobacteriota bacterium]